MLSYDFLVKKNDLSESRLDSVNVPGASAGEVVIRIDRFALTANNITYGVAGDLIGYWQFFPANEAWGRIPVWGVGTVIDSEAAGIGEGDRYYGYYPMSGHLRLYPGKVTNHGFVDFVPHRRKLPPVYNQYTLMTEESGFPRHLDNYQMIYRPLFTTSFVLDDFFFDHDFFGAQQVVLSSASSKTALGTAFLLQNRGIKTIGLTSAGNQAFVEGVGLYDQVLNYDEISSLDESGNTPPHP
jgi:hypothetical protein